MAKLATITQLSPTMKEGVFVEWQKKEGDRVKAGDVLAAIETDKAVMDLEAYDAGVILKLMAKKGDKLPVGTPIAVIGEPGENFDALLAGIKKETEPPRPSGPPLLVKEGSAVPENLPLQRGSALEGRGGSDYGEAGRGSLRIKASPLAKKIASQTGVDLKSLQGTGPGGRIVSRDLQSIGSRTDAIHCGANFRASVPIIIHAAHGQRAPDTELTLSPMRQVIAERLTYAKQNVPHFYLSRTVNVTSLINLRGETNTGLEKLHAEEKAENAELPKKVSVNDFIMSAVAQSLVRHPEVLQQFGKDHLVQLGNVDLGFAVSLEEGLITPIIRNADQYSLFQIALATQELSARARARKLKPNEYTGAGFTVSNLGMLGVSSFQAIINAPEAAILAVGASERRPYEGKNSEIKFGDFLTLNLACDHRVVDGATGAKFLNTLARYLENPGLIR